MRELEEFVYAVDCRNSIAAAKVYDRCGATRNLDPYCMRGGDTAFELSAFGVTAQRSLERIARRYKCKLTLWPGDEDAEEVVS